jgi:hypothetical protein
MLFHVRSWTVSAASALVIVAMALAATGACAQTFDVKQLEVKRGSLELGLDNTVHRGVPHDRGADVNRSAHDQSLDYGLRDWWRLSAALNLENPEEVDFRIAKTAVESLFVLKAIDNKRVRDIGLGWFTAVEASLHHDTTNSLIFGPIVTHKSGKLSLTANPFFEKTFGRNHVEGIALNYGWQTKYEVRDGFAVGVEGFGVVENLGNSPPWPEQEHRIGPVIFTEIALAKNFKITPDIGLLFGLTPATPDVALKLNVGIPLHQR